MAKQLIKFRGFVGGVIFVYDKNGVAVLDYYKLETDKIKGIPIDYLYVFGADIPLNDGSEVPMIRIQFDLQDESDMTIDGFPVVFDKSWRKIDGLTPVTLIQVGVASVTEVVVDVYSTCATGCNKPIPALVTADFAATGAGTISSVAESATIPGRYTITGTGFTDSTVIDLAAASALSLVYFPIISSGPITVNVA